MKCFFNKKCLMLGHLRQNRDACSLYRIKFAPTMSKYNELFSFRRLYQTNRLLKINNTSSIDKRELGQELVFTQKFSTSSSYVSSLADAIENRDFDLAYILWVKSTSDTTYSLPLSTHLKLVLAFNSSSLDLSNKLNEVLNHLLSSQHFDWNRKELNRIIRVVIEIKSYRIDSVFVSFLRGILWRKPPLISSDILQRLILRCVEEDLSSAQDIFSLASEHKVVFPYSFYRKLLKTLSYKDRLLFVSEIYENISCNLDLMTTEMYYNFANFYGSKKMCDTVVKLFEDAEDKKVQLDWRFFKILLQNLVQEKRFSDFMKYYSFASDCELHPAFPSFYGFLYQDISVSKSFLNFCSSLDTQSNDFTVHDFNCLSVVEMVRDKQPCRKVIGQLSSLNISPNWVTYFIFAENSCLNYSQSEVLSILDEMNSETIDVNIAIFSRLRFSVLKHRDAKKMASRTQVILQNSWPGLVYFKIIRQLISNHQFSLVMSFFKLLMNSEITLTTLEANNILSLLGEMNDPDLLLSSYAELVEKKGIRPNTRTFNIVLRSLTNKSPHRASSFFKQMLTNYSIEVRPNIYSYNFLLKALFKVGQYESGLALFEHMKHICTKDWSLCPNNTTCSIVLWCHAKRKDFSALEKSYREFSSPPLNIKPCAEVYASLIFGYHTTNEHEKAKEVFKHALVNLGSENVTQELLALYIGVLGSQASFTQLQDEWLSLPEKFDSRILQTLPVETSYFQALVKCGAYQEATEAFLASFSLYVRERKFKNTVSLLGNALLSRERFVEFNVLYDFIDKHKPTLLVYLPKLTKPIKQVDE